VGGGTQPLPSARLDLTELGSTVTCTPFPLQKANFNDNHCSKVGRQLLADLRERNFLKLRIYV
jgi:hypothetical protein